MNFPNISTVIKTFFIVFSSVYTFAKVSNLSISRSKYNFLLPFSFVTALLVYYIQASIPIYTIFCVAVLTVTFCHLAFKQNLPQTLSITILSIGINYAVFTILLLIMFPIISWFIYIEIPRELIRAITLIVIGILQQLLLYVFFRTKRFCNGIPVLINTFEGNFGIFSSALLVLFSSCFYLNTDIQKPSFHLLLISFILALGIIIWLWWQKSIQTDYINRNNSQQIDTLESKLQERDAELERLSKIIHKDNKLLAALELSTRELLQDASSEKAESLLQELNRFSKERSETLHAYEAGQGAFSETGLFSVDTMIRYLHQRAQKHKIEFQLNLEGDVSGITEFISGQDLCTIIADLGENAIIATKDAEIKNIRLSIERKPDSYALYFFDSGEPFAKEVLESLGKKRCTTHAETGGSGIGLMTTSELTAKYHGDFYITEEQVPQPYTKCVAVILKHPSEANV